MQETVPVRLFVRRTLRRAIISCAGFGVAAALVWSEKIGFGFMAGAVLSVINFQLMAVDAYSVIGKEPIQARNYIFLRSLVRYAIMFGFLAVIATKTTLSISAAFIGLFYVQAFLFVGQIRQAANNGDRLFKGLK